MPSPRWLPALALIACGGCDATTTSTIDTELQAKIETLTDCFPNLYRWVGGVLAIADTWKQQDAASAADPVGLTWVIAGGDVEVSLPVGQATIAMTISFFGPGGQQDAATLIGTPLPPQLTDAIDSAATALRGLSGDGARFLRGVWSITGDGLAASGEALTGILAADQDRLAELRTTQVAVGTDPLTGDPVVPDVNGSSVTDDGPPPCSLTFTIPGLVTDEDVDQPYPRGDVAIVVNGPEATVAATITFDKTPVASIAVEDVGGTFAFDVEARTITYLP